MARKIKLGGQSLSWMSIFADNPRWRVGRALYDKLYEAKEDAKSSIFYRAKIELSDGEIATLREMLKQGKEGRGVDREGRIWSTQALDELEKKVGIKPTIIGERMGSNPLGRSKAPRITPKTPKLRR